MDGENVVKFGVRISCFLGVFSVKHLKKMSVFKSRTCLIIIEKSHAIAVRFESSKVEVFDPLGLQNSESLNSFFSFLKRHLPCKKLILNTKVQANTSTQCAKFCLAFLYLRNHGYSFNKFLELFSENFKENDLIIRKLFANLFGKRSKQKLSAK